MLLSTLNARYILHTYRRKEIGPCKTPKVLLVIYLIYTRIFRTHILYTDHCCHAHNDPKRFVPNKILDGKPIPRSFHSFALEMKLFDSPFFCLSTLWSNSEWAITISPVFCLSTFVLIRGVVVEQKVASMAKYRHCIYFFFVEQVRQCFSNIDHADKGCFLLVCVRNLN